MTVTSEPRVLPAAAEPLDVRAALRHSLLGGADWEECFGSELGVGDALWEAWGPTLSEAGMAREDFATAVRGYRRELWFWVVGDRAWAQITNGLAGRLGRRLPAG